MARLYRAQGAPKSIAPSDGSCTFGVGEIEQIVNGYLQVVPIGHGAVMLIDVDGVEKQRKPNREASRIAGFPIVGDALICGFYEFRL